MQAQSTIEPTGRRSSVLARVWSVIRGDKYMANAYPPEWPPSAPPVATEPNER